MNECRCIYTLLDYGKVKIDITKIMKEKNLSKSKLCKVSGIHHKTIDKYVNQEITKVDLKILAKLCCALECDLSDILIYEKSKNDTDCKS